MSNAFSIGWNCDLCGEWVSPSTPHVHLGTPWPVPFTPVDESSQIASLQRTWAETRRELDACRAENAKLREALEEARGVIAESSGYAGSDAEKFVADIDALLAASSGEST